ncbi:MAG: hypothetical protein M3Z09_16045 [Acidobacteriota bacterium]|nr:hypothetical protein [Acidobacteriota bacterium]
MCPTQDEPEGGNRMLVIANQHEAGPTESGADPGVCGRQLGNQFEAAHQAEKYGWVERTLREQRYDVLARSGKGLRKRYILFKGFD